MNTLIKLLITAASAFLLAKLLYPHVNVDGFMSALIFAIVLAILNLVVKPILSILSLPVTILTLGLFTLVINTLIVLLADWFTDGITIEGFWWAFVLSILLSLITSVLDGIFLSKKNQ